jgi:hypothetical protein
MIKEQNEVMNGLNIDWYSRPQNYWSDPRAVFANIAGQARRETIRRALREGTAEQLPPQLFRNELPKSMRDAMLPMLNGNSGGERLPATMHGTIEIARLCVGLEHVVSFRAQSSDQRRIALFVVQDDESFTRFPWVSPPIVQYSAPLTLREMTQLIDHSLPIDFNLDYNPKDGFVARYWQMAADRAGSPDAAHIVRVESEFYPELSAWYRFRVLQWIDQEQARIKHGQPRPDRPATMGPRPVPQDCWANLIANPPPIGPELLVMLEDLFVESRRIGEWRCLRGTAAALRGRGPAVLEFVASARSPIRSRIIAQWRSWARMPLSTTTVGGGGLTMLYRDPLLKIIRAEVNVLADLPLEQVDS